MDSIAGALLRTHDAKAIFDNIPGDHFLIRTLYCLRAKL